MDRHPAGAPDADQGGLERTAAGDLGHVGDAEPDAAPHGPGLRLPRREAGVIGRLHRLSLHLGEVAAFVDDRRPFPGLHGKLVGDPNRRGRDCAGAPSARSRPSPRATASSRRSMANVPSRIAGAAYRDRPHLVRRRDDDVDPVARQQVRTRHRDRGIVRDVQREQGPGALVVDDPPPYPEQAPLAVRRDPPRSQYWSRSWIEARKCSRRSSIHLTGSPSRQAAATVAASSA